MNIVHFISLMIPSLFANPSDNLGCPEELTQFRIVPVRKEYAEKIRSLQQDEYGQPVTEQIATGMGPCRVSLKLFQVGKDKRLLIKHSPFEKDNAFNQNGPIFINANEVEEYSDVHRFPPDIKQNFSLTLIGYDKNQNMVFTQLVGESDVDELLSSIFASRPDIDFIHVRNAEAACYICKVERLIR